MTDAAAVSAASRSRSFRQASARRIARQLHTTVPQLHRQANCRDGSLCNGQGCRLNEWMGRDKK